MVGIVLVSHSRLIATGLKDLIAQVAQGRVTIEAVGGTASEGLGTDATLVVEAISRAEQGSGVVVLVDIGSSVLSAELAMDLLSDELRARVVLCDAPLIEGAIAAGVEASLGSPLDKVRRAAEDAREIRKLAP